MKLIMAPLRRKERTSLVDKQQAIMEGVTVHPVQSLDTALSESYNCSLLLRREKEVYGIPSETSILTNIGYAQVDGTLLYALTNLSCLIVRIPPL